MTALKGRAVDDFVRARPAGMRAALIYGPDSGLVRERAQALSRAVVADPNDPFNLIELTEADLKTEPGRLLDEAAQLSFMGGERVIRVRASGDGAAEAFNGLLGALDAGFAANALVVVEAGDLAKTSKVRKAFEAAKRGAALPCYADSPGDLRTLAQEMAKAEDLRFDADALDFTVSMLGEDRGINRSELEKLILYKGLGATRDGSGVISLADARACLADGVGEAVDVAVNAAADGALSALSRALAQSAAAGASPISLLRALQWAMTRLGDAQRLLADGLSPELAMKRLRPPVFFTEERAFRARLLRWDQARLDAALDLLLNAELDAKSTGAPQREIAERTALLIAMMVADHRR